MGKIKRAPGDYVAVVGGGMVGLACALNLVRKGARVDLIDDAIGDRRTSYGAAGHIAVEQVEPLASPKYLASAPGRLFGLGGALDFRWRDAIAWGPWAAEFLEASTPARAAAGRQALTALLSDAHHAWRRMADSLGRPELIRLDGHLAVWESEASARAGIAEWTSMGAGHFDAAPLDPPTAARLARMLRVPLAGGARFGRTGQFADIGEMLAALRTAFEAAGGEVRDARVRRLALDGGRAQAVLEDGQVIAPDRLVICAGVGSNPLMATVGRRAPVIAERGYHIEGGDLGWGDLPPITFEDRALIAVRLGKRLRVTSFVEFAAASSPPDPRKWTRLERHVRELGLPMGQPRARWMGARPTLPDYLPAIGADGPLIYAFGHQHLGLTLAATTGELVAALAAGDPTRLDLRPFDLARFDQRAHLGGDKR